MLYGLGAITSRYFPLSEARRQLHGGDSTSGVQGRAGRPVGGSINFRLTVITTTGCIIDTAGPAVREALLGISGVGLRGGLTIICNPFIGGYFQARIAPTQRDDLCLRTSRNGANDAET